MARTAFPALVLASVLALAVACGDDDNAPSPGDGVTAVTLDVMAAGGPPEAPGQEMMLSRVVIPAGAEIAPHTHPGMQMAFIAEGELTYTVHSDSVLVTRAAGRDGAREERVEAGGTTTLRTGDSIVEPEGMQHSARNEGDVPVVIYLSSLFDEGAPASSPAEVE